MKSMITKTSVLAVAFASLTTLSSQEAQAAPMGCGNTPVTTVDLSADGHVAASFAGLGGGNLTLCSVERSEHGWTQNACKTLLSQLNAALLSGKKVSVLWDSSKKNHCDPIPAWTNIASSYGFYWMSISN